MRMRFLSGQILIGASLLCLSGWASAEDDQIVGKVGTQDIPLAAVYAKVQQLSLADQIDVRDQLGRFTESVIQEELLFQYALKQAENDPSWREELKTLVLAKYLEQEVRNKAVVSDEELRAHYHENKSAMGGDHLALRHIPFEDAAACATVEASIKTEEDFAAAAAANHVNPVFAQRGGDIGNVMRGRERLGFEDALFEAPEPGLRRIDQDGVCHLVWVGERTTLTAPPFEEISGQIRDYLEAARERELLEQLLETSEATILVERYDLP